MVMMVSFMLYFTAIKNIYHKKKKDSNNKKNKWQIKNTHQESVTKKPMKIANTILAINIFKAREAISLTMQGNSSEGSRKLTGEV